MEQYDFVVIGGGSGGLRAAVNAATLGLKVCLVEKDQLGGDCLWTGCVPSKTLVQAGKVAHQLERAKEFGFYDVRPNVQFKEVMKRVWDVIHSIERHDSPEAMKKAGVHVEFGEAKFISPHVIEAGGKRIKGRKFMIGTGSRALIPPIKGIEEIDYLTNQNIFHLKALPKSLIVIGAGPIGIEMAQAFRRLGSEVVVVASRDQILPNEDADIARELQKILEKEGVKFIMKSRADECARDGIRNIVYVKNKDTGKRTKITGAAVLVATGRKKNVELDLEKAGVRYSEKGIHVNAKMRTNVRHIYAAGDVTDCPYLFTHVADYHASVVIANVCFKTGRKADYRVVPWVTYSDPELARVGLSEKEAIEKRVKYKAYSMPFADVDRAEAEGETQGLIKILVSPGKGELLGCHILGSHGGELLAEFSLAIKKRLTLKDIGETIHPYPTLSLVARQVTGGFFKEKIAKHSWIKKIARFMVKF